MPPRRLLIALVPLLAALGCSPQAEAPDRAQAPVSVQDILEGARGVSIGEASAPVTVYEFADFQCPACRYVGLQFLPALKQRYVDSGKVRFAFIDFPLSRIHPNAVGAAVAARCALQQDSFLAYHDLLYQEQDAWSERADPTSAFVDYADGLGLDADVYADCLTSDGPREAVQTNARTARSLNVPGTPTFYVNGMRIEGAGQAIVEAIESELAEARR